MGRPLWQRKLIVRLWPARFFAARLTRLPLLGWVIKKFFFDGDYMAYLPNRQSQNSRKKVVLPDQIVDCFIEKTSYRFLMHSCICRESNHCGNYPAEVGCLFLGEAARGINPDLGREVTIEEAKAHQQKVQSLGLLNLVGRNRLDKIWLGVKPANRLLTICHCCECCCLWKILPDLNSSISSMIGKLDGVEVNVSGSCQGCAQCVQVCFARAITVHNGIAVIGEACRSCGRCVSACSAGAITLTITKDDLIEDCVRHISEYVDVE